MDLHSWAWQLLLNDVLPNVLVIALFASILAYLNWLRKL